MTSMPDITRLITTILLGGTLAGCSGGTSDAQSDAPTPATSGAGTAAGAASPSSGNADLAEMGQYELTLTDVRKWAEIGPKVERIDFSRTATRELSDSPTIDELEELYEGNPEARAAIEQGGMDVRDFVVTGFVLLQGGFAQHMMSRGISRDSASRITKISVENLEFLEENAAEIRRILGEGR